jgi:hypothetical protein
MKVYGYWDKATRFIYGPGNFEMDSAKSELTPFYTKPVYEGQEPFACIKQDIGIFLHYPSAIGKFDLVPVYQG